MRTIDWVDDAIAIIDQTALPGSERILRITTVDELIAAIQSLAVRGAPALGVAGAMGVALAAFASADFNSGVRRVGASVDADLDAAAFDADVRRIAAARPTAVNLARGALRAAGRVGGGPKAVLEEALAVRDEEIAASAAMASRGADLVTELCGDRPRMLTHCNTGALAAVTVGTALGVVLELHRRGMLRDVIASETRPLLQGARLTAWELSRAGVDFRLAVDGAGPFLMARGEVDAVVVGADRICANGDTVPSCPDGAAVPIEDRAGEEVNGAFPAANPAFDVTPHDLITAIVTDRRVIRP